MENTTWQLDEKRKPKISENETELFSEHGRVLAGGNYDVDYRSHWFVMAKSEYGEYFLYVQHGGGEEKIKLKYFTRDLVQGYSSLKSDGRFLLFWQMFDIKHDAERNASELEAGKYRLAFIEGRLKKRKLPKQNSIKVWIERKLNSTNRGMAL